MPPSDLAPFIIAITLTLSVAAVFILRPLTKRLGDVIELKARERQARPQVSSEEIARVTHVVSRLADRIELLEERQDFAERLLSSREESAAQGRLREPNG